MNEQKSYGQILKATSIMGGVAVFSMTLGLLKSKAAAVLIGAVGVGLLANLTALQNLLGTVTGVGLQSSAVRQLSLAAVISKDQFDLLAIAVRRLSVVSGAIGLLTTALLGPLLGSFALGSKDFAADAFALAVAVFFANLNCAEVAIMQGARRIDQMAIATLVGTSVSTVFTIGLFYVSGVDGIVPAIVVSAIFQYAIARFCSSDLVALKSGKITWIESLSKTVPVLKLGLAFMWNSLLLSLVTYLTLALITKSISLEDAGIYSAAFMLSGIFVNFVLNAMGADYYPRLTEVSTNREKVNELVNQQTEIGLLLALPGLIATMIFSPFLVRMMFTEEFLPAADLLRWFILGCFGRVVSWPLGFVILAKGRGKIFVAVETGFNLLHLILIWFLIRSIGLTGVSVAFVLMYLIYAATVLAVCKGLTGFKWTSECKNLILLSISALTVCFAVLANSNTGAPMALCVLLFVVMSLFSLVALVKKVGLNHPISKVALKVPMLNKYLKSKINHYDT